VKKGTFMQHSFTVNNAGYALVGAFEETWMDEIMAQFETNFFGAIE
jgi:short-subunit dehydrogenase